MSHPIIQVKNIGKKYDIVHQRGRYVALRDVVANVFKNPFSFLKHKAMQATGLEKKEEFWALKDVNFTVNRGEVIGIIGHNGAGKSTLLKILSQITPPTTGEIVVHGKIGSLLEVGTGFHPELTGRENIFLNGAILGMKRTEIAAKFDDIVEFAGIEKFLDTPVKHYSSGMYVRLAFSVAAHMEPDILLVDEVLAVGDAEFQKKCLGKMDEITKKDGRTILFVSHNLSAIQSLCEKSILIEKGQIKMFDSTSKVIDTYIKEGGVSSIPLTSRTDRKGDGRLAVTSLEIKNAGNNSPRDQVSAGEDALIQVNYEVKDKDVDEFEFSLGIDNRYSSRVSLISSENIGKPIRASGNSGSFVVSIKKLPLNAGDYFLTVFIKDNRGVMDWIQKAKQFTVTNGNFYPTGIMPKQGDMLLDYNVTND